jgi:hypothetical protein
MKYTTEWQPKDYRILKNYIDDTIFVALEKADNEHDFKSFIKIFSKSPIECIFHIDSTEPVFGRYNFRNDAKTCMLIDNALFRHQEYLENLVKEQKYKQLIKK